MVHQMNIHDVRYEKEIAAANYPEIRQFWIPTLTHLTGPQNDLPAGNWQPAVGESVRPFSAVAYFFAKKIYDQYHVPIGIINASVGGTPIEAWISEAGLKDFPSITSIIEKNKDTAYNQPLHKRGRWGRWVPSKTTIGPRINPALKNGLTWVMNRRAGEISIFPATGKTRVLKI